MNPSDAHLLGRVEVPAVDDDGAAQRRLDPHEVRVPVFVPVGDDDQRVRSGERFVVRLAQTDRGRPGGASPLPSRPDRARRPCAPAASSDSMSASDGDSRMSSVFGLNDKPPDGDARARESSVRAPRDSFSKSRCFWRSFAASTASSTFSGASHSACRRNQRLHVLREAGAAVAGAREQEGRPDARVASDRPCEPGRRSRRRARRGSRFRS